MEYKWYMLFFRVLYYENSHTYNTHTHNCPKNEAMVNYRRNYIYVMD